MSDAVTNGGYPVEPEEGTNNGNNTSTNDRNRRGSHFDQRPQLYNHYSSTNTIQSSSSVSTADPTSQRMEPSAAEQQRSAQSGPARHKPTPLNLQVPGSAMSDSGMSGVNMDMKSPYAGSYIQRQGYRPAQHPNGSLNATGRSGAEDEDRSAGLPYPGYSSGQGDDHSASSSSYPQRSGLIHSASMPVLPTASFPGQSYATGDHGMTTPTYPPYAGMYSRNYSYPSPMSVDNGSTPYSGSVNGSTSSATNGGQPPLPPPFNHSYSSPSVPMYPPPLSHYGSYPSSGYGGHQYSPSGYMMSPTSTNPSAGPNYPGTPGVLMINSSGQVIPHNPGSLVGGRGIPLSERPFKCDECIQSFNRNHDLKRHKRIHLAVKPFACEKCGKQFSRKDALRRHWLVKGCRSSDDPNVNMHNPAYNANPPSLSPPTPEVTDSRGMSATGNEPNTGAAPAAETAVHGSLLRTPSYAGPLVVTPDEQDTFPAGTSQYYQQYTQGGNPHNHHSQISPGGSRSHNSYNPPLKSAPIPDTNVRSLSSPQQVYGTLSQPAGLGTYAISSNLGKSGLAAPPTGQNGENKLPGRFSFDARTGIPDNGAESERVDTQRSYSMSIATTNRIEGDDVATKRPGKNDYFAGVFPTKESHGQHEGDQAAQQDAPNPQSSISLDEPPSFTAPFERERTAQQNGEVGRSAEAYPRWHRPSFPFPATQSENLYQRPESMDDSTDLRKTVTRANASHPGGPNLAQTSPIQPRWTRASFPFPENPDNGMGLKDEVRQGA